MFRRSVSRETLPPYASFSCCKCPEIPSFLERKEAKELPYLGRYFYPGIAPKISVFRGFSKKTRDSIFFKKRKGFAI